MITASISLDIIARQHGGTRIEDGYYESELVDNKYMIISIPNLGMYV